MATVVLSNHKFPEDGQVSIPLPIPPEEYEHCMEMLEVLCIGHANQRHSFTGYTVKAPIKQIRRKGGAPNLYWEDGLFFSIKTNEDAVWNLYNIKAGDPIPELTAFDAQKWRSGLGAYFFSQCSAQKNADGKWSYTVGQEAIS